MKCPKCGTEMELTMSDCCAVGCCGISSKSVLTCPSCGHTEE